MGMFHSSSPDLVDHARVAIAAGVDHALALTRVVIGPGIAVRVVLVMVLVMVLASKLLCQRNIPCGRHVGADILHMWFSVCTGDQ